MEQANVIGRLAFLANIVGDGAVKGIQQMARGTGAAMTKLASAVPAAAFATSASALAAVGAALVGGVKAAADFEESFALVRKVLARASEQELGDIRQAILDLSTEIPVAAGQLAQLGSIAGQLGVEVQNIPQFIDTVAKLGVATNMTAEQAAFSVARLANVTGIGAENADQLANVLVRLGNNTAATESEITLLATRFGAVGKIAGLTADQTLAFSASVRATGTEAQAGATALQKFFLSLQQAAAQGGNRLKAFSDVVGMSSDEFRKLAREDIAEAAAQFVEGLDSIGNSGGNVQKVLNDVGLGSVRVSKVMLSLSADTEELRSNLFLANDEMERQSALNNEAEKRFGTLIQQIARFRNVIKKVLIDIGEGLVPVLAEFVGNLADAISGAKEFQEALSTEKVLNLAKALGVLTAALGLSRLQSAVILFNTISAALTTMTSASFIAANAFKMLFIAFKPFLIAGAIIGGITAITKVFSNFIEKTAIAKRNLDDFKEAMDSIKLADEDIDISDAMAEGLFDNLEEETQQALKDAFGSNTQNVLKDILGNTSRNISDVISETFALMQKNTLILTSAGTGSDEAKQALRERISLMEENLKVVEETFGTESEIALAISRTIRLSKVRLEEGRLLNESEENLLNNALEQVDVFKVLADLQNVILDQRMEELKIAVRNKLLEQDSRVRVASILKDDESILAVAKELAKEDATIAKLIGYVAEDTEEIAENFNIFAGVLEKANDFATELNAQLKPLEALEDLEDAQKSLREAKKDIVELGKEEVEVQEELASIERELNDLLQDGKFLSDDILAIKEEELELAEMIKAVNEGVELSYQEQLKLLKLEREQRILQRAAEQGTLSDADVQLGAIQERIDLLKSGGVTEEDILEKTAKVQDTKNQAQINANERITELLDQQQDANERLLEIDDELVEALDSVKDANLEILQASNKVTIAFAELEDKGTGNIRRLGEALGYPKSQLDGIISRIQVAQKQIGLLPAFNTAASVGVDPATLQSGNNLFEVPRAMGGMVRMGQRALVGERGAEIIKPMPHGVMVTPMQGGGSQPINQYVNLNITGLPTDPMAARKIAQNIQRELNKLKSDGRSGIVR